MRGVLLLAIALAGCLRSTEFKCQTSDQCGASGVCETTGYCSLPDDTCGRRYSSSAGPLANQCVGGGDNDAGVDARDGSTDAPTDTPAHCTGFQTLSGAPHTYQLVTQTATWDSQVTACVALDASAYLAIPGDANELAAITTLAGGSAPFWVGVSDRANEGQWRTVQNMPQTFLPWATNHPITSPPNNTFDCVRTATSQFTDDKCNVQLPAICECE
jgi:hypothetical protein